MIEQYFNINYIFGKENVWAAIDEIVDSGGKGFVNVADGVVVSIAQKDVHYRETIRRALFSCCDSSWVPLYLKKIYGIEREQYCGPQLFHDLVSRGKHRMFFMGTHQSTLDGLKKQLPQLNPAVGQMSFYELPFLKVEQFDYPAIARMIEADGASIIWVALGAPKQDYFMDRLLPHLHHGVLLGVGAAFKFYSGTDEKRAPQWMRKAHLEFIFRILQDPKKQLKRCWGIISTLPRMIREEKARKHP